MGRNRKSRRECLGVTEKPTGVDSKGHALSLCVGRADEHAKKRRSCRRRTEVVSMAAPCIEDVIPMASYTTSMFTLVMRVN